MSQEAQQDSGLVKRGLILLVAIGGLVVVVLWIIFQRPGQPTPAPARQPEPIVAGLVAAQGNGAGGDLVFVALLADQLPSRPGWEVRYNAAASLARLGSDQTPWATLAEMLDERQQMLNFRVRLDDGRIVPDEAAARLTVLNALRSVKQWYEKQSAPGTPDAEQAKVNAAIARLAESAVVELKKQAEETREAIKKKAGA
ncbi:MAG: hypothetical protein U0793_14120 [Gemmataceae bacterium]